MISFNPKYFTVAIILFIIEVLIAVYLNDSFIRPYVGDFLVVILIYCFVKTFWRASVKTVALCVLVFSYVVEVLQYFKFVKLLGLQNSRLANVILGNTFVWNDIVAYTSGLFLVVCIERVSATKGARNGAIEK